MKLILRPPDNLKPVKLTPGNIYSTTHLAFLTNPTELARAKGTVNFSYPVIVDEVEYADVEEAFQLIKRSSRYLEPEERFELSAYLIRLKLDRYPFIPNSISLSGGVKFLEQCNHLGGRSSMWTGHGRESGFIRCLIRAFETWTLGIPIEQPQF